ncbi:hypothetical protein N9J58_00050 [bacterium]|nr:hypothetical protein [bacterium]
MMRHVIWIDIGTHQAQEFRALFASNYWFFLKLFKRIFRNFLTRVGVLNFRYEKVNVRSILKIRNSIRKQRNVFKFVFVEPNPHIITANSIYQNADIVAQVAVDVAENNFSFAKLYFGNGEKQSQGSSLFLNKHNIVADKYQVILSVDADKFFSELKRHLDKEIGSYVIVLRLNCEGAEDSVVYSAAGQFGQKLKLVLGSLKDVGQIKGLQKQLELEAFLKKNELTFEEFSSDVFTWLPASKKLLELCGR